MPARPRTKATERWPISRYEVCSRCRSASIIEFSKWVRRHHVTKELGSPSHPFAARKGAAASVNPVCMSTTVPYWSNMQTLMEALTSSACTIAVSPSPMFESPVGILTELQRNPAVNNQFEARDVFRLVRSEIQAGIGNVPGIAHVPDRTLSVTNLPHLLDIACAIFGNEPGSFLDHGGLHSPGRTAFTRMCRLSRMAWR